jgi:hypothetical protein
VERAIAYLTRPDVGLLEIVSAGGRAKPGEKRLTAVYRVASAIPGAGAKRAPARVSAPVEVDL